MKKKCKLPKYLQSKIKKAHNKTLEYLRKRLLKYKTNYKEINNDSK